MDNFVRQVIQIQELDEVGDELRLRAAPRIRRVLRDRSNPFDLYDDSQFRKRFRFSKVTVRNLLLMVGPLLEHRDNRGCALSPVLQLLLALRFYSTGCFHRVKADLIGVHESTACRAVQNVTTAIGALKGRYINFPTRAEFPAVAGDFALISR